MIYWMYSSTFNDLYLENEDDEDILNAEYILISGRIYGSTRLHENVTFRKKMTPGISTCGLSDKDDIADAYMQEIMNNISHVEFLAAVVESSVVDNKHFIFMCTDSEAKGFIPYLKYIGEVIYLLFGYPVYDYKKYVNNKCELIPYDKSEVLKKIDHIKQKLNKQGLEYESNRLLHNLYNYPHKFTKEYIKHNCDKKVLKHILKKNKISSKGLSKSDMLNIIKSCL